MNDLPSPETATRTITKKQIAAQLKEAANLLDVLGDDAFRAKAFMSASRQIENYEGDISMLLAEDRLTDIKGIGKKLAEDLSILKEREFLPVFDDLYERVPEGVRELFKVSGLGAKKISALWQHGVDSLESLVAASEDGTVASLKGFGKKSAEKFAVAAHFALEAKKRLRLDQAEALNDIILTHLQNALPKARVATAGEYRRRLETVGRLEFIISQVSEGELTETLSTLTPEFSHEGGQYSFQLDQIEVVLHHCEDDALGAVLALHTGNDDFVEGLKKKAEEGGLELRSSGLFKDDSLVKTPSEADVFASININTIAPELRESADAEAIDNLVTLDDMNGQIHNHSTWSDAVHSIREMVQACRDDGFDYLGMADHSRTSYYANGLSIERVFAQAKEIKEIRQELADEGSDFGLLHGIEVDIMPDGSLDYPDDVLATLDYTVVSVHQNFTLSQKAQTERIVNAVMNPYSSILGHATGRLLLRRPSYEVDQQAIIEACAETGTIIEINASPYRLDMDWRWIKKAKALGCKFSLNPDAHHIDGFADLKYGVMMARKAGLTPEDVINTAPTAEAFLALLKKP